MSEPEEGCRGLRIVTHSQSQQSLAGLSHRQDGCLNHRQVQVPSKAFLSFCILPPHPTTPVSSPFQVLRMTFSDISILELSWVLLDSQREVLETVYHTH